MAKHKFSASAVVSAPPQKVYQLIADYQNGHPRILPRPYFLTLNVEQGGYGEGTIINYQMKLMGRIQSFRSVISEPTPGSVLVETDLNMGAVTTFTVEPHLDGKQSFVTIMTTMDVPDGILGQIQGWLTSKLLQPIYVKELKQLGMVAADEDK